MPKMIKIEVPNKDKLRIVCVEKLPPFRNGFSTYRQVKYESGTISTKKIPDMKKLTSCMVTFLAYANIGWCHR